MNFNFSLEPIKRSIREIYASRGFPMIFLGGSILIEYFSNDVLWIFVGIGGFLFFTFVKKDRD